MNLLPLICCLPSFLNAGLPPPPTPRARLWSWWQR